MTLNPRDLHWRRFFPVVVVVVVVAAAADDHLSHFLQLLLYRGDRRRRLVGLSFPFPSSQHLSVPPPLRQFQEELRVPPPLRKGPGVEQQVAALVSLNFAGIFFPSSAI